MIEPGLCTVVSYKPDGSQPRVVNALGHVDQVTYSFSTPGGADQFSCLLQQPVTWRDAALNAGRILKVMRGGSVVWDGKMQEPAPSTTGWTLTGNGVGNMGTDFDAFYTATWGTNKNDAVNQAITRGLRWVNPGITAAVWFGQQIDPAAQTITDLLNLFCTKGALTWEVKTVPNGVPGQNQNILTVKNFPAATFGNEKLLMTVNTPVGRTLGGYVNTLWGRYQSSLDGATAATFATTSVSTPGAAALHGVLEDFVDISSAGQNTAGTTQAALNAILARYQRVSYAGPFTVHYGELLNKGGAPVDLGLDYSGQIVRMILLDYGYGGEVVPNPVIFMIGNYAYDDQSQTAQITPFQSLDLSIGSLLSMLSTTMTQIPQPKPPGPKPKPKPKPKRHITTGSGSGPPVPRKRPAPRRHLTGGTGSGPPVPVPRHKPPRHLTGGTGTGPPVPRRRQPARPRPLPLTQHDIDWVHKAEQIHPDW